MLQDFRKFSKVFLYIVIAAFVGTIIFAWGADITRSKGEKGIIGEVNGEEIDYITYSQIVDNYYQQISRSSQREISQDELLEIRNRAWVDLVTDIVYRQTADKLGIELTNAELAEHLKRFPPSIVRQHPEFTNEQGQFDYQKYLSTMQDTRYAQFWLELESISRNELRNQKLLEIAMTGALITDEDVKQEFIAANELVKVEYALVLKDAVREPQIVNDSNEVIEYYNSHKDRYFKKAEAELKYIELIKTPTANDSLDIRQQIASIHEELMDSVDFAGLARDLSEDGSAQNGGDLGWFGEGAMVKPFEDAAFALKDSGDISDPVESEFGWHIIMKTGEREQDGTKEIRASHILLKFKPSGQTITDLQNIGLTFLDEAEEFGFDKAAENSGLEIKESGPFTEGTYCAKMGQSPSANEFAFSNDPGTVSHLIEEKGRFVIARIDRFTSEGIRSLEESFTRADADLTQKKLEERSLAKIREVYTMVQGGKSMEEAATEMATEYYETALISRNDPVRKLGRDPNFIGATFRLSETDPLSGPVAVGKGAVIINLLERQPANLESFAAQQDTIFQRMIEDTRQKVYSDWFNNLQESNEVKDYREQLYGSSY